MDYISGWCRSQRRLEGLTAIVTGCNTGIGKETALDLYLRGARVIMACRDIAKAEKAKKEIESTHSDNMKGRLLVAKLDLSSLLSVHEFTFQIYATETRINILINNAGVMCCPEGRTEDGFETHIGTNHFGHALLTLLLLPLLIRSAPARIVFVSSSFHKLSNIDLEDINLEKIRYDPVIAYSRSKAANVLFARALARKLKEHNITDVTTYSLHPGVIKTEIGRHFGDTVCYGSTWLHQNIPKCFLKSPRCGAQTTLYCAVDEACASHSGLYYSDCRPAIASQYCERNKETDNFWKLTMKLLNLQNYNPFTLNKSKL